MLLHTPALIIDMKSLIMMISFKKNSAETVFNVAIQPEIKAQVLCHIESYAHKLWTEFDLYFTTCSYSPTEVRYQGFVTVLSICPYLLEYYTPRILYIASELTSTAVCLPQDSTICYDSDAVMSVTVVASELSCITFFVSRVFTKTVTCIRVL